MSELDLREVLWGDDVKRLRTVLCVAFIVAAAVYLLVVHGLDIETEVIRDRYWKNAVPLFEGEMPVMEYPPLALIFIAIPRIFGSTEWGYETAYVAMMVVIEIIGLLIVSRLADDLGRSRKKAMLAYTVLAMLMIEFVLDRFDMIAMVIALAAVMFFVEKKYPAAFVLLAVGTLVKLYPAILFPVFFIYLLYTRQAKEAGKGFVWFAATGLIVAGIFWLIDSETITGFLEYNTGRPLQVESLWSSIVYVLSALGLTDVYIEGSSADSFWSDNLRGDLADSIADVALPVTVVLIVLVWLFYIYRARAERDNGAGGMRLVALACLASVMTFLAFNKVYSTQYLIWAIGPALFAAMTVEKGEGKEILLALMVTILLGQLDFAYNVGYLGGGEAIDDLGMVIILLKNLATLWVLALALKGMAAKGGAGSDEGASPSEEAPAPEAAGGAQPVPPKG